jgi:phosphoenolpyruvate carboxylase
MLDVKTLCNHTEAVALVNLRLDAEDARRVAELSRAGVEAIHDAIRLSVNGVAAGLRTTG